MKFELKIDERTSDDVASALSELAKHLPDGGLRLELGDDGKIRDSNGNTVGQWEVTND
jgi:hypothetical protein